MKLLLIALTVFSFSAMAQLNDFECEKRYDSNSNIFIEVERPVFRNASYRDIEVTFVKNNETQRERYFNVWMRSRRLNRIIFNGSGMRLEIDTFRTNGRVRWGIPYPAVFASNDFNGGKQISNLICRYTGF